MDELPGGVFADILNRLPPRTLAACRSVCNSWRATIDAHRLLRRDLLPLSLAGIFVVYHHVMPEPKQSATTFFSRPSVGARIQGDLRYLDAVHPPDWSYIGVHCNGLVLLQEGVVNPATRQWVCLPPYPDRTSVKGFFQRDFLAFDPTVSPHFEVLFMHCVLAGRFPDYSDTDGGSGWPPSPFVVSALSSTTWRWEERSFVREGMAVRSVADVEPFLDGVYHYHHDAVYWRGRLYVYDIYFVVRLSLEDNKYRVIQLPPMNEGCGPIEPYFGKSEKGVNLGFVHGDGCTLQIWFLDDESTDHTEWTLKHEINLRPSLANFPWKITGDGSWAVQGASHGESPEEPAEWDSDNEDGTIAAATQAYVDKGFRGYVSILGFHPYKEIVFLHTWSTRVMAYHLNSSRLEDLGCLPLDGDDWILSSCTYTPCWMESCLRVGT